LIARRKRPRSSTNPWWHGAPLRTK
jgi:hypothetical protein